MTKEEAINQLQDAKDGYKEYLSNEALDMAIKALEQEPSDDVVSRDAVKEQMIMYGFHAPDMTVTEFVEDLPPVNPKEPTTTNNIEVDYTINGLDDFIAFGKKAFGVELAIKKSDNPDTYEKLFETTKNDLGVDCISRADACSLICKIDIKHRMFGMSREVFKDLYHGMDELPSVTPQPRWIPVSERLPDYSNYVLVTVSMGSAEVVDMDFYSAVEKEGFESYGKDVIAWMPRPTPYEPQESVVEE